MKFSYSIKERESLAWALLRLIEEEFPEFINLEGFDYPLNANDVVSGIARIISDFRMRGRYE